MIKNVSKSLNNKLHEVPSPWMVSRIKSDLSPTSERPERRVDACFYPKVIIFHHTIDSGSPGDDPRASEANVHNSKLFSPSFEDFCYQFQNAVHIPISLLWTFPVEKSLSEPQINSGFVL